MKIASVSKFTVVADFFNMSKRAGYYSMYAEGKDFQVFPQKQLIVQVMKPANVEVLCFEDENLGEGPKLNLFDRIFIPTAYSVGCTKASEDKLVLGCADGAVKIFNTKTATFQQTLPREHANKVFFVDFNCTDELVASVRGIGRVDLYNLKSNMKINTVVFDANTLLARFHPRISSQLAGASFKGAVYVYDVHTNHGIFNAVHAHSGPCSDISMSPSLPQTIISVGIDAILNIFDMRAKQRPEQIKLPNLLSSVAISENGQFFCVGDMAGKVTTFDMRDTSTALDSVMLHKSAVTRVAILPNKSTGGQLASAFSFQNGGQRFTSETHEALFTPTSTKERNEAGDRVRTLKNLLPHFAVRRLLPPDSPTKESLENSLNESSDDSFYSSITNYEEPSASSNSFGSDFPSSNVYPREYGLEYLVHIYQQNSKFSVEEAVDRFMNWKPFGVARPKDNPPPGVLPYIETKFETAAPESKPEPHESKTEPDIDSKVEQLDISSTRAIVQQISRNIQYGLDRMEANYKKHADTLRQNAMNDSSYSHNVIMDSIDKIRNVLYQYELRKAKLQDILAVNDENEKLRKILRDSMHGDNQP